MHNFEFNQTYETKEFSLKIPHLKIKKGPGSECLTLIDSNWNTHIRPHYQNDDGTFSELSDGALALGVWVTSIVDDDLTGMAGQNEGEGEEFIRELVKSGYMVLKISEFEFEERISYKRRRCYDSWLQRRTNAEMDLPPIQEEAPYGYLVQDGD